MKKTLSTLHGQLIDVHYTSRTDDEFAAFGAATVDRCWYVYGVGVMRSAWFYLALAAISVTGLCGTVRAEESMPLSKLPGKVLSSVLKAFPKTEAILGASQEENEEDDDELMYEVTITIDGKKIDVTVDDEGEIELLEKEMDLKALPKALTATLTKMYPKATAQSAEGVYEMEDGEQELEFYEVQLKMADGKVVEAKIQANGKVAEDEVGDEASDDEEEHEDDKD